MWKYFIKTPARPNAWSEENNCIKNLPLVSSSIDPFFDPPDWESAALTPAVLDMDSDRCATLVHDGATFIVAAASLVLPRPFLLPLPPLPVTMQSELRWRFASEFFSRRTKSELTAAGIWTGVNSLLSMGAGCQSFDDFFVRNDGISDTRGGDGFTIAVGFWLIWFFRYGGISNIFMGWDVTRNDALVDGLIFAGSESIFVKLNKYFNLNYLNKQLGLRWRWTEKLNGTDIDYYIGYGWIFLGK